MCQYLYAFYPAVQHTMSNPDTHRNPLQLSPPSDTSPRKHRAGIPVTRVLVQPGVAGSYDFQGGPARRICVTHKQPIFEQLPSRAMGYISLDFIPSAPYPCRNPKSFVSQVKVSSICHVHHIAERLEIRYYYDWLERYTSHPISN